MRLIIISLSLLSFWITPKQLAANTNSAKSIIENQSPPQITNKFIALLKKCQKLSRKIASKNIPIQDSVNQRSESKFINRKPQLSVISSKKNLPRETVTERSRFNSTRTKKSTRQQKSSWSFLDLFSRLHGPAPFARR